MRNPRRVLSKAQILDRVWNYDFGGQANVVELYISYLRKKIDAGREPMIHTVRGVGYVLKPGRLSASVPTAGAARRGCWSRTAGACWRSSASWSGWPPRWRCSSFLIGQLDDQLAPPSTARRLPSGGSRRRPDDGSASRRGSRTSSPRRAGRRHAQCRGSRAGRIDPAGVITARRTRADRHRRQQVAARRSGGRPPLHARPRRPPGDYRLRRGTDAATATSWSPGCR